MAAGTKEDPWVLKTPPGTSSYTMYRDEQADPPALVCQVGSTTLKYQLRGVDDLHEWLVKQGDWVPLGAADEKKDAKTLQDLAPKADTLMDKLGPEYAKLMDGLDQVDENSAEGKEMSAIFGVLDTKCK